MSEAKFPFLLFLRTVKHYCLDPVCSPWKPAARNSFAVSRRGQGNHPAHQQGQGTGRKGMGGWHWKDSFGWFHTCLVYLLLLVPGLCITVDHTGTYLKSQWREIFSCCGLYYATGPTVTPLHSGRKFIQYSFSFLFWKIWRNISAICLTGR